MVATLWVIPITAFVAATLHLMTRWGNLVPRNLGKGAPPSAPALEDTDAGPGLQPTRTCRAESAKSAPPGVCDAVEPSGPAVITRENLEQLCRSARVGELSVLLTTPGPRSRPEENLDVLVEFEMGAIVDYPAFLRLQQGLSTLLGRKVVLFAKGRPTPHVRLEPRAVARVLYAV